MWKENDELIQLSEILDGESASFPAVCPSCGGQSCHAFVYNPSTVSKLGSIWIWCESCKGYTHYRGYVPEWVSTPGFIDEVQLCSDVDYLNSKKDQIDAWLSDCFHVNREHIVG